jgi:hypothetical protein
MSPFIVGGMPLILLSEDQCTGDELYCLSIQYGGQLVAHTIFGFDFRFLSPVRRRVAEAGQGILTNMFEHVDA